jgi:hypothetical protein
MPESPAAQEGISTFQAPHSVWGSPVRSGTSQRNEPASAFNDSGLGHLVRLREALSTAFVLGLGTARRTSRQAPAMVLSYSSDAPIQSLICSAVRRRASDDNVRLSGTSRSRARTRAQAAEAQLKSTRNVEMPFSDGRRSKDGRALATRRFLRSFTWSARW